MKKWLVILLAMAFLVIVVPVSAEDSMPKIENFRLFLTGPRMARLNFDFTGVKGGLPGAEFTIIYKVERNGFSLQSGRVSGLKFVPNPGTPIKISTSLTGENGEVRAAMPVDESIKLGDRIKYSIYLVDGQGRESNTIEFVFTFVEAQII